MKKLITLLIVVFISSTALQAQNGGDVEPPDGLNELSAWSLFYEGYKNEQYETALKYGRWILEGMPRELKGYSKWSLSTQLDRLISVYSGLAQKETDPGLSAAYVDTADMIYDKVFANFSEDEIDYYQWHLTRGTFYYENADFIDNAKAKQTAEYKKAFELKPAETTKISDGYYLKVMLQNLVAEDSEESKQEALALIEKAESNAIESLIDYFDSIRNKLFDSPEERIGFLQEKLEEEPENQDVLRQLRSLYTQQDNLAEVQRINEKLYELDPSYQNSIALANFAIENAENDLAIKYLNEAKSKTDDSEKLKTIYYNLATAHKNKGSLRAARNSARQAINADASFGQPYILIADVYAQAVTNCSGSELERSDRAVYWLVLDYLYKAKRADSSVSSAADTRLRSYREYTPTKNDIFYESAWNEGDSIRVDSSLKSCYSWINESTTVR